MEGLVFLLTLGLFAALILLGMLSSKIKDLRKSVDLLSSQISWLLSYIRQKGEDVPEQWEKPAPLKTPPPLDLSRKSL